jgi:tRNA(Arg) A34 adenosine deaminase TadA
LKHDSAFVGRLLDVIEHDILPLTRAGVSAGNKIFGAAILRKSDLSLVIAATNNEMENPLWHGEVHAIKHFHELARADRPSPRDCIFLATHEPCSLCLSAITWAGYDNFYYLFSHEDSRDTFDIPHDLNILKQVFRLEPGGYNASNVYWNSYSIRRLVAILPDEDRMRALETIERIARTYAELSETYRRSRDRNDIPLQ